MASRAASALGMPTPIAWMSTPFQNTGHENVPGAAADSGTTIRLITKYMITP